jgi:DNA-binding MarR family transcriptional regulator
MNFPGPDYGKLNLPILLRLARAVYSEGIQGKLAEAGFDDVPPSGRHLMGNLDLSGAAIPLAQLIAKLGTTKQVAGQAVDTLVLRGYVHRSTDEADRRRLVVGLTERGIAAARVQRAARERIDQRLAEELGPGALAQVRKSLACLIELGARMEREPEPQDPPARGVTASRSQKRSRAFAPKF